MTKQRDPAARHELNPSKNNFLSECSEVIFHGKIQYVSEADLAISSQLIAGPKFLSYWTSFTANYISVTPNAL